MKEERFIIKYGRFGAYFFDTILNIDLDLEDTLIILNKYDGYMVLGKALEGYQR